MNFNSSFSSMPPYFFMGFGLIAIWSIFWKGLALWNASKHHDKKWFIAILLLNTCGILELVYLFGIKKIKWENIW